MPENHPINDYIAGAIAGSAGLIAGHPLDTTKVQIQTQVTSAQYRNTWDCIKTVNKQGWTKGFFRGMSWPVMSYGAVNSVFFGVYGNTLSWLHHNNDGGKGKPCYWEIYLSGCVAGAAQLSIACPIDLIKVVLQSQIPHGNKAHKHVTYAGPLQVAQHILREKGIRGLYRGLTMHTARDIPASGTYFTVFEMLNDLCAYHCPSFPMNAFHFLSGGIAGVVSWLIIIPLDVIKSQYQADCSGKYKNIRHCVSVIYREGGFPIFFTGVTAMTIRAFCNNSVALGVYGFCIGYLTRPSRQVEETTPHAQKIKADLT